jgi:hypothetical protein
MLHKVLLPIFLSMLGLSYTTHLAPGIHILVFSGWLAYISLTLNIEKSLWISLMCGLITDCTSLELPLGVFATIFCLSTTIIKQVRTYFSFDNLASLFLFSYSYSIIATLLQNLTYLLLKTDVPIKFLGTISSLLISPLFDALFFIVFVYYPSYFMKWALNPSNIRRYKKITKEKKLIARKATDKLVNKLYARRS